MINHLKPYPAYKDSGVPWLGKVPEHWEVPRLGSLLRERRETNDDGRIEDVLSLLRDRGVIPYSEKGNIGNKKSEDISRYKIVRPDDIVMNSMNVIIGSVGISRFTGCLSPVYYVLTRRSAGDDPKYLNAVFQTKSFQESLVRIGNGILAHRMRIPMELLKCEPFPRPPLPEQRAITRFLDHADRLIRRYIRAKQKLIKLLEEQKQAIIHQAVTRGLDPNVRLKPSGVEWLGDVPEGWEVRPLKNCIRTGSSISYGIVQPGDHVVNGVPFVQTGNLTNAKFELDDLQRTTHEIALKYPRSVLAAGDVLLGIRASVGMAVVAPQTLSGANLSRGIARIVPGEMLRADFLVLYLGSRFAHTFWAMFQQGTTFNEIPISLVRILPVVLPPLDEQATLVAATEERSQFPDRAIADARQEITLLQEYRTRLIADVVTGKLDVRWWTPPAEVDEPEETDEKEDLDNVAADEISELMENAVEME